MVERSAGGNRIIKSVIDVALEAVFADGGGADALVGENGIDAALGILFDRVGGLDVALAHTPATAHICCVVAGEGGIGLSAMPGD